MPILRSHPTTVGLAFVFSLLCQFVPVFITKQSDEPQFGYDVLTDPLHESVLRIAVALCIPILLELLQDHYFTPWSRISCTDYIYYHKLSIVFTFFVPNLLVLVLCVQPVWEELYLCLKQAMVTLLAFPTVLLMNFYDNDIWTNSRAGYVLGMNAIARVFWTLYFVSTSPVFKLLGIVFRALMIPMGLPLMVKWFYRHGACIKDVLLLRHTEDSKFGDARSLSVFYVLVAFFIGMTFFISSISFPEGDNSVDGGRMNIIVQVIVISLIALIPGRLARRDAVQSDNKLENKKAFVQYISHEARGPLSVANMGLELHLQDMMAMDKQISDRKPPTTRQKLIWLRETIGHVEEIVDACSLAQTTLSDLLTFDKIEKSGMADMEKTPFEVIPFVDLTARAFAIQARYKNIDIAFNWLSSLDVDYEHMTVMADRGKLLQALRNLLSNALKFSPEGGKLSIVIKVFRKRGVGFSNTGLASVAYSRANDTVIINPGLNNGASDNSRGRVSSGPKSTTDDNSMSVSLSAKPSRVLWGAAQGSPKATTPKSMSVTGSFMNRMRSGSFSGDTKPISSDVICVKAPQTIASCYSGHADMSQHMLEDVSHSDASRSENVTETTRTVDNLVCRIEVQDSGPGISKANISKLFGKFVQFDAAKIQQGGGSGLGLWLTRSIMESHGGGIGARSEGIPGRGTVFFIDIPLYSLQELNEKGEFMPDKMLTLGKVVEEEGTSNPLPRQSSSESTNSAVLAGLVSSTISGINQVLTVGGRIPNILCSVSSQSSGLSGDALEKSSREPAANADADAKWTNYEEQQHVQNAALAQQIMMVKQSAVGPLSGGRGLGHRGIMDKIGYVTPSPIVSYTDRRQAIPNVLIDMTDKDTKSDTVPAYETSSTTFGSFPPTAAAADDSTIAPVTNLKHALSPAVLNHPISLLEGVSSMNEALESGPKIHVMVVDDMASNRKMLRRAVSRQDRNVVCIESNDGADAVDVVSKSLRSRPPPGLTDPEAIYYDIIFLDSQMGVMDGPVACKQLRDQGYTGLIYGISGDARSIDMFKEAGANGGYIKPIKINDLKVIFEGYKATLLGESEVNAVAI